MLDGYANLGLIGRGAFSTIYRIRCKRTGKIFALKEVKKENDPQGLGLTQMEHEFTVSQAVQHPNVRQAFELVKVRKLLRTTALLMRMEYLEGRTLEVAAVRDLPTLVMIFSQAAGGLEAMHQAGYVHADIKPNNIMIHSQRVKIFDLGQSCRVATVKERIQGTPDFIAPEQVLRLPLDQRTDVFNLGAALYWCLTGKAYPTRIKSSKAELVGTRDAKSPQELNPQVPTLLSNLVMDCCRNSPSGRPENMAVVIQKLRLCEELFRKENSPAVETAIPEIPKGPDLNEDSGQAFDDIDWMEDDDSVRE
ncbi:MAG: Serine/threonine-protein kinase PknD [Phycisphaerae bacterium]|nr:Serine/threonine-protein kinase PknD [Phycisphaerae bacterium]